ncbi:MAG TPA: WhiB family transcriptional regulator [Candidatus Saccharimonadales bacterium]|nr:WhiB family transcriptional regulator [Candidatus Saccharimonadales bacterium]
MAEQSQVAFDQLTEAIRSAAELLASVQDPEQLLRGVQGLGTIATGALELGHALRVGSSFEAFMGEVAASAEPQLTTSPAELLPADVEPNAKEALPIEIDATEVDEDEPTPDEPVLIARDDQEVVEDAVTDDEPAATISAADEASIRSIEDHLAKRRYRWTPREQRLLQALLANRGEPLAPADLMKSIDGTLAARRTALRNFGVKLRQHPAYAEAVRQSGKTWQRRIWLAKDAAPGEPQAYEVRTPDQTASMVASGPESSPKSVQVTGVTVLHDTPRPQSQPTTPVRVLSGVTKTAKPLRSKVTHSPPLTAPEATVASEATRNVALTSWGLTLSENGHRQLSVNGTPLRLRDASIDVLLEVCRHPQGVTFEAIRSRLAEMREYRTEPPTLSSYLAEIAANLQATTDASGWSDSTIGPEDDQQRLLKIDGALTTDQDGSADFLGLPPARRPKEITHWRRKTECASVDPEAFFSERSLRLVGSHCTKCVVADECLAEALQNERGLPREHRVGIWGGLLPAQRQQIKGSDGIVTPAEAAYIVHVRSENAAGRTVDNSGPGRPSKEKAAAIKEQQRLTPAYFQAELERAAIAVRQSVREQDDLDIAQSA